MNEMMTKLVSDTNRWIAGEVERRLHAMIPVDWKQAVENALADIRSRDAQIAELEKQIGELELVQEKFQIAAEPIGGWLSAALSDPNVCGEMKQDIRDWFAFLETLP
jgi:hypothetical protein